MKECLVKVKEIKISSNALFPDFPEMKSIGRNGLLLPGEKTSLLPIIHVCVVNILLKTATRLGRELPIDTSRKMRFLRYLIYHHTCLLQYKKRGGLS